MRERLKKYDEVQVNMFCDYVQKLQTEKDKTGKLKNYWATKLGVDAFVNYFEKIAQTGLYIDGDNITINNNGISLNYQAYKNLVIKNYPEATFDIQLVKQGDVFSFSKQDGKVHYNHVLSSPFEEKPFIGGYCIVKLRTGEHIETMSLEEMEKIRKTAKTDYIWSTWTNEMYIKTLMKRACKRHFKDIVEKLEAIDNENYDLEKLDIENNIQTSIDNCTTTKELTALYKVENTKGHDKETLNKLIQAMAERKAQILGAENANT